MSKNETIDTSIAASNGSCMGSSPDRTDWDRKLSEARIKRAQVLSARALAQSSQDAVEASKPASPRKLKITMPKMPLFATTTQTAPQTDSVDEIEAARVKFSLTGANALKALFVFCGAAGFGMGTVVGLGILMGLGAPVAPVTKPLSVAAANETLRRSPTQLQAEPVVTGQQGTMAKPPAELQTMLTAQGEAQADASLDNLQVFSTFPEFTAANVEISLKPADKMLAAPVIADDYVPPLPGILDKDLVALSSSVEKITLPRFTQVSYMQNDVPVGDAALLRTLPIAEATFVDGVQEFDSQIADPEFFVHAPDGLTNAELRRFVAQLEASGVALAKIGREDFRVSTTHLRYYSTETEEAAKAVARDLGVPARDFSENTTNSVRIEVWVAGPPKQVVEEKEASRGLFYWLGNGTKEER